MEKWKAINNQSSKARNSKRPTSRPLRNGKISSSILTSLKPWKYKKKPNPPVSKPKPSKPPPMKTERSITISFKQPMALVRPCHSCCPWLMPLGQGLNLHRIKFCNFLSYSSRGKVAVNEIFKPQGVILLQTNVLQEQIQNILKEFIEFGEKTKS